MLTDILEVHFVELPKFLDEEPELNSSLNKWLAFLTRPEKEVMEVAQMAEPAIRKAITVLDMLSRDPEMVRLAELRMKKILDEKSMIEGAKEEGKNQGKIEGKEEDALSFLRLGISEDIVAQGTGLSTDKVRELKEKLKKSNKA